MNKDLNKLISQFKNDNYPNIDLNDERVFTLFCMKYFFYESSFSSEDALENVVDGANDGGIDAVFTDPNSDENDVIIIQSKYYKTTRLTADTLIGDITKINSTLNNYVKNNTSSLSSNVRIKLSTAVDEMQENGHICIHYFTSYETKTKKEYDDFIKRIDNIKLDYEINIHFGMEILDSVNLVESGNMSIPTGRINIDIPGNYLKYEESRIVNASAKSILELYNAYKDKGLFAQNLRHYIKDKNVDSGIRKTLKNEPQNFWFYNNGLIIMAEDFQISGKEVKLSNFSIINGGQTTSLIGMNSDIIRKLDLYVPVKIISIGQKTFTDDDFASKVARASNSQKAIKAKDLIANRKEQIDLKSKLSQMEVFYELKRGEKKQQKHKNYIHSKSDQVAKLVASTILQIPGTARSNTSKLYTEDIYHRIFTYPSNPALVKDLLMLELYYKKFKKIKKDVYAKQAYKLGVMNNGMYFVIALLIINIAIQRQILDYDILEDWKIEEKRKYSLKSLKNIERLIVKKQENEEDIVFGIFDILIEKITNRYDIYKQVKERTGEQAVESNFMKLDINYYNEVVYHLLNISEQNTDFEKLVERVFVYD
ncbi:MAG: AIPR family protein [Acholeplasma sp.]|nr:AIPR family protein [Acholeplasma sp.]